MLLRRFCERSKMTDYLELPIGEHAPDVVVAVIEIPQGSINKYEYDKQLHVFRLDRNLHSPVHYPGDYGFVPRTLAEDGDPLDILVLGDAPTFPGCIYFARPIGLFEMLDQGIRDEKILAYATGNPRFSSIQNYTDVMPHILKEVEHFFSIYKDLEGKRTKVLGWKDRETAHRVILRSHERFGAKNAHLVGSGIGK
jgi:inorganic pyrophosphatase